MMQSRRARRFVLLAILLGGAAWTPPAWSQLLFVETFDGETSFLTTPEVDLVGGGGMGATPAVTLTGDAARLASSTIGALELVLWEYPSATHTTAGSDLRVASAFENLVDTGTTGLTLAVSAGIDADGRQLAAALAIAKDPQTVGVVAIAEGHLSGIEYGRAEIVLSSAVLSALRAGEPFQLLMEFDAVAHTARATLVHAGVMHVSPDLSVSAPVDPSLEDASAFGRLFATTGASGSFSVDLDHFSLFADASVFQPRLNLDIGGAAGVPAASYAAAGSPGVWNPVDVGAPQALVDVDGFATSVTSDLFAVHSLGFTPGSNALKGDHLQHCSPLSTWRLTLEGLGEGPHRVRVYAPADGTPTGPMEVNGVAPLASLPGEPGVTLTEGVSWSKTTALTSDGFLFVEEATPGGCTGLAGVQIEDAVPVPEPAAAPALTASLSLLAWLARRRRRMTGVTVAVVVALHCGAASAQTWEVGFEASLGSLPSAQGWTYGDDDPAPDDGLDESNYAISVGALVQGDTGGPNADPANLQTYDIVPLAYHFDRDDIVVDLRIRVVAATMQPPPGIGSSAGFSLSVTDLDRQFVRLEVGETGFFLRGSGSGPSGLFAFDTTAGFADYQLRVGRERAALYLNGLEVRSLDRDHYGSAVTEATAGHVEFGDRSSTQSSSTEIERVRVARFQPVQPEVRNYQTVTVFSANDSSATKSATASCPPFTNALGGGATTIGEEGSVAISATRPTPAAGGSATAWHGAAREIVGTGAPWQLRVDVLCGQVPGYQNVESVAAALFDANQNHSVECPAGSVLFSGGGEVVGPDLSQALVSTLRVPGFPAGTPPSWGSGARDNGATTSAAPWQVGAHAICTSAPGFEIVTASSPQDGNSPKEATVNCPTGKVPIAGGAGIQGHMDVDGGLRFSGPKFSPPETAPVGWIASAQSDSTLWSLDVEVLCAPIADPTVSKTGLVARYEGESGADDSWGAGHGDLMNGVGFESGVDGFGFSFDATLDQWVDVPSHAPSPVSPTTGLYALGSFTVEAWIRTTTLQSSGISEIFNLVDAGGPNGQAPPNVSRWAIRLTEDGYANSFFADAIGTGGETRTPNGTENLADGELHHIVMMRDLEDRRGRLYVDGVLQGEVGISSMINDGPLLASSPGEPVAIGIWRNGGSTDLSRGFTGMIDDLKFYDRALSEEEIQNTAGCAVPILPRTLNVDASLFGSDGVDDDRLCVFLEAGDYVATLVHPGLDPAARMTGWSPSPASTWSTEYAIEGDVDPGTTGGFTGGATSAQQAFDDTLQLATTFTLTESQRVHFSVSDSQALDNRGGVSLRLEAVPEPGLCAGLACGALLLGAIRSRRPMSTVV